MEVFPGYGGEFVDLFSSGSTLVGSNPVRMVDLGDRLVTLNFDSNSISILSNFANGAFQRQDIHMRGTKPSTALAGDFNGDGATDLIIGSNGDGLLELFLHEAGELVFEGLIDTDLNPSAMALSVVQGSRVFYVTSDGVARAFAFSLDDFAMPSDETAADLPSDSVAIIAALVAGGGVGISGADFFTGQEGETVNFDELLFFAENALSKSGTGADGDTPTKVLEQLRDFFQQFVQAWYVTFGNVESTGWQAIFSATQTILDALRQVPGEASILASSQTIVSYLRLPEIGYQLAQALNEATYGLNLFGAGGQFNPATLKAMIEAARQAGEACGDAAMKELPKDTNEGADDEPTTLVEALAEGVAWNQPSGATSPDFAWDTLATEYRRDELLLAGLLAASTWKPAGERRALGRRPQLR